MQYHFCLYVVWEWIPLQSHSYFIPECFSVQKLFSNKDIQGYRLQEHLSHVPSCTNLRWLMPCAFVSFVTVVDQKPLTDLSPHSPVFRSLFYQIWRACWGSSLRGKQNICAGQAGSAGRSKSVEGFEEGQNLPRRALFNQKEVTVLGSWKENTDPGPVQFPLQSSRRKPL